VSVFRKKGPELGYSFATFLGRHLMGLHRELIAKEWAHQKHKVHIDADLAEAINARNDIGRAFIPHAALERPVFCWWVGDESNPLGSAGRCTWLGQGVEPHYLVQLYGRPEDCRWRITDGMATDLLTVLASPADVLTSRMKAVIDHHDRRRREAEQEAENQRCGHYEPVFLEVRQFETAPTLSDASVLIAKSPDPKLLQSAADALRPSLSELEASVLYWMVHPTGRTMTQMAAEANISKGYASKLRVKLWNRLQPLLRKHQ